MEQDHRTNMLFVVTKSDFGGAQRYVYDLATNLPQDSFDVTVAFGGNGTLAKMLKEKGVHTVSVPSLTRDVSLGNDITALIALIRLFRRERPNIVHLNSSKAGGLGSLAARISGVPRIIFTSHGLAYDEDRSVIQRTIIYLATWATFLLSHAVICISEDTAMRARSMWLMKDKVHLVYNSTPAFPLLDKSAAREALAAMSGRPIPEYTTWIGAISELVRNKGLSYAIEACAELKRRGEKFVFFIIGDGDLRDELMMQIRKYDLDGNVFLLGFVPEARKYLQAFDIFTLTSVKEGLPYVLLEAAQAPVAVVASDIPGIRDIVKHNETGLLVPPKDPHALAEALVLLSKDEVLRWRLARPLHGRGATAFSFSSMVKHTIALSLT